MAQTYRGDSRPAEREVGRAGVPGTAANDLLDDDHNRVLQMFNEYANNKAAAKPEDKRRLTREVCRELEIHARLEEEIWYPCVHSRSDAEDRVDAAVADHARIRELIRSVRTASTHDATIDNSMQALDEAVRRHIHEERDGLFEVAEIADCNTAELARALLTRRKELEKEIH